MKNQSFAQNDLTFRVARGIAIFCITVGLVLVAMVGPESSAD